MWVVPLPLLIALSSVPMLAYQAMMLDAMGCRYPHPLFWILQPQ